MHRLRHRAAHGTWPGAKLRRKRKRKNSSREVDDWNSPWWPHQPNYRRFSPRIFGAGYCCLLSPPNIDRGLGSKVGGDNEPTGTWYQYK